MSAERDDLAAIIGGQFEHGVAPNCSVCADVDRAAAAVEVMGYRKPRTITTVDEARQLRVDAVLFSDCTAYQNYGDDAWAGSGRFYDVSQISLPAVVLYEP